MVRSFLVSKQWIESSWIFLSLVVGKNTSISSTKVNKTQLKLKFEVFYNNKKHFIKKDMLQIFSCCFSSPRK